MDGPADPSLYEKLFSQLVEQLPALRIEPGRTQFQFPLTPMPATWGEGTPEARAAEALRIGDRMPREHGPFYEPAGSVSRLVWAWVNAVIFLPHLPDAELTAILKTIGILFERRHEFLDEPGARAELAETEAEIQRLNQLIAHYAYAADRPLLDCRNANNAEGAGRTLIDGSVGALEKEIQRWRAGAGWRPHPLVIDGDSGITYPLISLTPPDDVARPSFFGLPGPGDAVDRQFTADVSGSEGFSLSISLGGLHLFGIERPGWYDREVIRTYAEAELADPTANPVTYFDDQTGALALVPAHVLVAWNPSVMLTMDAETYRRYQERLESGQGLRAGPFLTGAGAKPAVTPVGQQVQVVFQNPAPAQVVPYIIGFCHDVFNLPVHVPVDEHEVVGTGD